MTTFKQFIAESINDKGIMKAVFIIGLPGAGKSYTASKLNGTVSPRIVNTDRAIEHIGKTLGVEITSDQWHRFKDSAHRITSSMLFNYLNGMLPLFIDGTSNDASNILHRIGILESLGYDVGIVHIDTPLDIAIKRAEARNAKMNRKVDLDFIKQVHARNEENVKFLKSKVKFFKTVMNQDNEFGNEQIERAFKAVQGFFSEPVDNPVGKRMIDQVIEKKAKYLTPGIIPLDMLKKKVEGWYKS